MKQNILSTNEIRQMLRDYHRTNDISIRNDIVEKCLYICPKLAKKYSEKYDMTYDDVLSLAYEGLINAVEQYDIDSDTVFYAYASVFITGFILNEIRSVTRLASKYIHKFYNYCHEYERITGFNHHSIEAITYAVEKLRRVDKMSDASSQSLWTTINLLYPVSYSHITDSINEKEELKDLIELEDLHMDIPEYNDEELLSLTSSYMRLLNKNDVEYSYLIKNEIKSGVNTMIGKMKDSYQDLLKKHYGINGVDRKTLYEIAKERNKTYANIQIMEMTIMGRIRRQKYGNISGLKDLLLDEECGLYDEPEELGMPSIDFGRKKTKN